MNKLLLFLLLLLFQTSYSQTWQWAEEQGPSNPQKSRSICADNVGNCYAAGEINYSTGNYAKVIKYTSAGDSVWNIALWRGVTQAIASDNNGYLYVSGDTSVKSGLAKIDTSGNVIWKTFDTIRFNTGIAFANTGQLYLIGDQRLLAKYDTMGNKLWDRTVNAWPRSVCVDLTGNICITGRFSGTAIFGTDTLSALGTEDIFVAKYDSSGTCMWARRAGGSHIYDGFRRDIGYGIVADQSGNVYFTGSFVDTAYFGALMVTGFSDDIFLAKYSSSGDVLWVKTACCGWDEEGRCIAIDHTGHILIGGSYVSFANFGGFVLSGSGHYDAFVAKYDSAGTFITAISAGGPSWNEYVYGIATDNLGNVFTTGIFCDSVNFGPHVISVTTGSSMRMFVAKLDMATGIEIHTVNSFVHAAYPNPATSQISIEFNLASADEVKFEITNVLGQVVYSSWESLNVGKQKKEFDIENLVSGIYFLNLRSEELFSTTKFVKN